MNKQISTVILLTLIFHSFTALSQQNGYQTFYTAGFKVKCNCTLRVNSLFIKMMEDNGKKVIAAYVCAENENSYENGVINNINIYDESPSYSKLLPNEFAIFEKKYLEQYSKQLNQNDIDYKPINFLGFKALEYSFNQEGIPTMALTFLRNKKSYLIQVASNRNLETKFRALVSSFQFVD